MMTTRFVTSSDNNTPTPTSSRNDSSYGNVTPINSRWNTTLISLLRDTDLVFRPTTTVTTNINSCLTGFSFLFIHLSFTWKLIKINISIPLIEVYFIFYSFIYKYTYPNRLQSLDSHSFSLFPHDTFSFGWLDRFWLYCKSILIKKKQRRRK